MKRQEISELHYIVLITTVPSILKHGILSHSRATKIAHDSVALEEIQARRRDKRVPGAGRLHDYANLYFDAHNPMLSRVRDRNDEICVLRVSTDVLDLPGVIVADCNASSDYVHFQPAKEGLLSLNRDRIFARYWTHPEDPFDEMRHKSEKCAEVLVPDRVDPCYIESVYVSNTAALDKIKALGANLAAHVKNGLFF